MHTSTFHGVPPPQPSAQRLRSQGMQTDLPLSNTALVEGKVFFRVVHGDKVLQFKLGWQSPLQILFSKLDIRADFVWHGVVLDESLSPQQYNMLPGEENTVTLHVVRSDGRTTTHQEDIAINDAIRAMGLKLRLQEEKTAALQRENDALQGQLYALHREMAEINTAAAQMIEEERAKVGVATAENARLLREADELRAEVEALRHQLLAPGNTAAQGRGLTAAEGGRDRRSVGSTTSSAATPVQSIRLQQRSTAAAARPASPSASLRAGGGAARETQIAVLRNELSAWQNSVKRPLTSSAPPAQPPPPPAAAASPVPSATPIPPSSPSAPPEADLATRIRCVLLNEISGEQKKLPPLVGPPNATITIGEAIAMLRERHGAAIPPSTALMTCVQRLHSAEYTVIDTQVAPNLRVALHDGDTLFVANMAA